MSSITIIPRSYASTTSSNLPRPTSRTRFHILSQLPSQSRSRSRSPFRPPPIKPRRIYQQ
ncbi:unnamed protein product, partial [Rotaria sp. Silwood1]